ncbi:MAG: type III pantothenate kinase [Vicingaceae bacterium]
MNLVIDIGNTRIKYGFFEGKKLLSSKTANTIFDIQPTSNIDYCIISSVKKIETEAITYLKTFSSKMIYQWDNLLYPFINKYQTKATLGQDRIALVCAGLVKYPNHNILIIDMGTCITYDFIDASNTYHGGAISPGLNTRYKALNAFTGKLPLVKHPEKSAIKLTGNSTEQSILSGVYHGILFEIKGFIEQYESLYKNLTIIMTGGDSKLFDLEQKNLIFADENFLLTGINELLLYNIENKII